MKMKLLSALIAICTVLFAFGMVNVSAATSGACGDNLTWTLDGGTLTIRGQGDMRNYLVNNSNYFAPWYSSKKDIVNVVIENGVTSIGDYAFSSCDNLTSITIPDSVTSIGDGAFSSCSNLVSIIVSEENPNYCSIDGVLFNKTKTDIVQCPGNKTDNYILPDSTTNIGNSAFSGCSNLKEITIPNTVTSIGDYAFYSCDNLTSITIPDSVTSIGDGAFSLCSSLVSITIPDRVTSIGDDTFINCRSLKSITLPNGLTNIGNFMFYCCYNLENITIPNSVTTIGEHAFHSCGSLVNITIPANVKSISYFAFYNCNNLTDVYYNGTEEEWSKISIKSSNESLTIATIHFVQDIPEQYHINEITIKDMSGNSLQAIPTGTSLATVSFTNVSSSADTVIILAQYTEAGAFRGLMYIQTEDVPTGSTIKLSIPVDNSTGDIATLKAFCWESFGNMIPMGNMVSYPTK